MTDKHTPEPWQVSGTEHIVAGGTYVVALDCKPADARRIVACVNACAGIPIEKLQGKTIADYVTSEAYLTGIANGSIGIEGLGPSMLGHGLAGILVGSDAPNYLEMSFTHPEAGCITVTIQKSIGKTPHQLRQEAEKQRDDLLKAAEKAQEDINWMLNNQKLLNPFVFDYLGSAIAAVKDKP